MSEQNKPTLKSYNPSHVGHLRAELCDGQDRVDRLKAMLAMVAEASDVPNHVTLVLELVQSELGLIYEHMGFARSCVADLFGEDEDECEAEDREHEEAEKTPGERRTEEAIARVLADRAELRALRARVAELEGSKASAAIAGEDLGAGA